MNQGGRRTREGANQGGGGGKEVGIITEINALLLFWSPHTWTVNMLVVFCSEHSDQGLILLSSVASMTRLCLV